MSTSTRPHTWYRSSSLASLLVALVLVSNLYAAIAFLLIPSSFTAAYELAGAPGEAAVAGMGLLFLMWQVPYIVALINPLKHQLSLLEALIMQGLGVIGETFILLRIPLQYATLRASITRFLVFDAAGFALLALAWLLVRSLRSEIERKNGI